MDYISANTFMSWSQEFITSNKLIKVPKILDVMSLLTVKDEHYRNEAALKLLSANLEGNINSVVLDLFLELAPGVRV